MHYTDQAPFDARFEWGEAGLRALGPGAAAIVIVDVLSFSTAVDVAVGRGASAVPFRWRDGSAAAKAESLGAFLAVSRNRVSDEHPYSLSPASMAKLPAGSTIVLPSPNGATLSAMTSEFDAEVFAGCLRNASSVAAACRAIGGPTVVIAAGERWGDVGGGSLRPAFEDLIGAGAILAALGTSNPSPEACAAIAAFEDSRANLLDRLETCSSGRELTELGFKHDVMMAAEFDIGSAVPHLCDGAYVGVN
ncbi:MAG: 2-phosphosulfolactate phosphatase [Thermomicrobiales bacterium]